MTHSRPLVVLKFGGTSVATPQRWSVIADRVRAVEAEGARALVVCSAVAGVSDALAELLEAASRGAVAEPEVARGVGSIRARHAEISQALGLGDGAPEAGRHLDDLERLVRGISLVGEVSPGPEARVMATGELLSTRLGAAWLRAQGVAVTWVDARDLLQASPAAGGDRVEERSVLSAVCDDARTPALDAMLPADGTAVITQGFIARGHDGGTVLLGRGGSDTSAAYLSAKLGALRCEIWTDIPGMFTANPRQVSAARLLRRLDYDETQELASAGARILHPRAIGPLRTHGIPLHVRSTLHPEAAGTIVAGDSPDATPRLKAIASRRGLTLIAMETARMWQQVGFLADVFARFKARGLSVDLVSTSETNVTVSLDPTANALDEGVLRQLLDDLRPVCDASAIGPCASVTLVGRHVRSVLHQLGPALEVFEEQRVHLVTQAASDLNLTFVVDDDQAERLVARLHKLVLERGEGDNLLGPTTAELEDSAGGHDDPAGPPDAWWRRRRDELLAIADEATPMFVYDLAEVDRAARALQAMGSVHRVLFAVKANPHPEVLRRIAGHGFGLECVSPGELERVFDAVPDLDPDRVLFTPNFAPRPEYERAYELGVHVTLDNLHPLAEWPDLFRDRPVFVRVDPGEGRGHHAHVRTAGALSKFGVAASELPELIRLADAAGARIVGLHAHSGSGIRTPDAWPSLARLLARLAADLPNVRHLDVGGGLGVPEKQGQRDLDLRLVDESLAAVLRPRPDLELWIEPGRYLVAAAGVLLAHVTQRKRKGDVRFVGVNVGMNTLIRPALYGAYHEIRNLSRLGEPTVEVANVVGPICESGDTLGHERPLPRSEEGDVLLIANAGAYGRAMSSEYNLRAPAGERVLP